MKLLEKKYSAFTQYSKKKSFSLHTTVEYIQDILFGKKIDTVYITCCLSKKGQGNYTFANSLINFKKIN